MLNAAPRLPVDTVGCVLSNLRRYEALSLDCRSLLFSSPTAPNGDADLDEVDVPTPTTEHSPLAAGMTRWSHTSISPQSRLLTPPPAPETGGKTPSQPQVLEEQL